MGAGIRTLVIGAGSIGSRRARILAEMGHEVFAADLDHSRESEATNGRYLTDWCDHQDNMAEWFAIGQRRRGQLEEFGLDQHVDAVFICTPAATHVPIAFAAAQGDVPALFIEKPLSVDLAGLDELVTVTENLGIVTMGACNMRWAYRAIPRDPPPQEMGLLTSGPLSQWRPGATEAYAATGIVLESAIHDMDLATYFLGPIEGVDIVGAAEGFVDMVTRHPNGRRGHIKNDWRSDAEVVRAAWTQDEHEDIKFYLPDTSDAMYREEMEHFLAAVEAGDPGRVDNSLRCAVETLGWALRVREQVMGVRT